MPSAFASQRASRIAYQSYRTQRIWEDNQIGSLQEHHLVLKLNLVFSKLTEQPEIPLYRRSKMLLALWMDKVMHKKSSTSRTIIFSWAGNLPRFAFQVHRKINPQHINILYYSFITQHICSKWDAGAGIMAAATVSCATIHT